jgi:hypothetical protein
MGEKMLPKAEIDEQIILCQQLETNVRVKTLHSKVVQIGRRGEKHFKSYRVYALADSGDSWQ